MPVNRAHLKIFFNNIGLNPDEIQHFTDPGNYENAVLAFQGYIKSLKDTNKLDDFINTKFENFLKVWFEKTYADWGDFFEKIISFPELTDSQKNKIQQIIKSFIEDKTRDPKTHSRNFILMDLLKKHKDKLDLQSQQLLREWYERGHRRDIESDQPTPIRQTQQPLTQQNFNASSSAANPHSFPHTDLTSVNSQANQSSQTTARTMHNINNNNYTAPQVRDIPTFRDLEARIQQLENHNRLEKITFQKEIQNLKGEYQQLNDRLIAMEAQFKILLESQLVINIKHEQLQNPPTRVEQRTARSQSILPFSGNINNNLVSNQNQQVVQSASNQVAKNTDHQMKSEPADEPEQKRQRTNDYQSPIHE